MNITHALCTALFGLAACAGAAPAPERTTGDLGVIVERAVGAVQIVDVGARRPVAGVEGLGDLSHASVVFSRDMRYAYVFGRDGALSQVDLLTARLTRRVVQSGNSIGGAISQDGRFIAASNYTPGGVKIFDAATLALVADLPARGADAGAPNKSVGIVDLPGNRFASAFYETGDVWIIGRDDAGAWRVQAFEGVGRNPYDAGISPEGRYYLVGLFGEDGLDLFDTWHLDAGPRKVLAGYGKDDPKLPVYKMPHMEGWGNDGRYSYVPGVGRHEVLVVDRETWATVARVPVAGQPVFCVAAPDGRSVWVNFALPDNGTVQVLDTETNAVAATLTPGKAVLHLEFTPKSEAVWMSARDDDRVVVYDTETRRPVASFASRQPSGIFFTSRAHRIGM